MSLGIPITLSLMFCNILIVRAEAVSEGFRCNLQFLSNHIWYIVAERPSFNTVLIAVFLFNAGRTQSMS